MCDVKVESVLRLGKVELRVGVGGRWGLINKH